MAKKSQRQKSGGARMTATGKRSLMPWYTPEERELIDRAAIADGRKPTGFVQHYSLEAARSILEKKSKNSAN